MNPRVRRVSATALLILCLIGWPLTQFWLARDEPPVVLGLSWGAMILTAIDILATTDVRAQEE